MPFAIVLAPEAVEDLGRIKAAVHGSVKLAMEPHFRHEPEETSAAESSAAWPVATAVPVAGGIYAFSTTWRMGS